MCSANSRSIANPTCETTPHSSALTGNRRTRFRELRNARTMAFVTRNARAIADLQERGLADRGVDASMAAMALSGMVARLAFESFTGGAVVESIDELVETATRLWTNALGLTTPELRAD